MPPITIRPMHPADIPQVVALEHAAFHDQLITPFARELNNRLAHYMVATRPTEPAQRRGAPAAGQRGRRRREAVVGYAGLWFVVDESHLTAIAVDAAERRRGIGTSLMLAALELAIERQAIMMTLEVRASNIAAQTLYQRFGFRKVGVRKGYYSDNHEDAWLMTVEGIAAPEYREKLDALRAGLQAIDC